MIQIFLAYVPTSDVGTIAFMGVTPQDLELLAEGADAPLIEFEEAMQRGIPLPKFLKVIPVADQDGFTERLNVIFENAGIDYDAKKFKPMSEMEKMYERDED